MSLVQPLYTSEYLHCQDKLQHSWIDSLKLTLKPFNLLPPVGGQIALQRVKIWASAFYLWLWALRRGRGGFRIFEWCWSEGHFQIIWGPSRHFWSSRASHSRFGALYQLLAMYCLGNYFQVQSICQQRLANVTKPRKTPGSLSPHHPSFKSNSSNVHTDPAPTMPRHLRTHSSSN